MGTRGAYGFRLNQKDYITYNHFDSYPSGLGNEILKAARKIARDIPGAKEKVARLKLVTDKNPPTTEEIKKLAKYTDITVSSKLPSEWYVLLRNIQGQIEEHLESGYMIDSAGFLSDSLFCEWAYIINLDDETLEVYKGFNQNPKAAGRYAGLRDDHEFNGVVLLEAIPLTKLSKDLNKFEKT